jgi:PAS domain-containing protein
VAAHTSTLAFLRLGRRKPAAETSLTAVGADRPPRLLLKFGIYAGIALVVAAVAGTWLASRNARVRAERDVWADARYTADQLGRDDLARTALGGLLDAEGKIVFANQKLAELLGREPDGLPGAALVELMDEHSRAAAVPALVPPAPRAARVRIRPSDRQPRPHVRLRKPDRRPRRRVQRRADDDQGRHRAKARRRRYSL